MKLSLPVETNLSVFKSWSDRCRQSGVFRFLSQRHNLILVFGVLVSLIGLAALLQSSLDAQASMGLSPPIALGLFFLGIALVTILDERPYDETPRWLWPVRYVSLLAPAAIGAYFLSINLMSVHFDLLNIWIVTYAGIPPVISILTLLLSAFSLYIYLTGKRSEEASVFLINIPALIILNVSLFVLMTYWQGIPLLYNFKLPVSFILASVLISLAFFTATIPYRGLLHPIVSESVRSRWMAVVALAGGLLILLKGSQDVYHLYVLSSAGREAFLTARFITASNLIVVALAILVEAVLLRQTHYYNEVTLYDRQLQETWVKRQALVYNIIQAIPSITLNLEEVFQKIVNELGTVLKADRCLIARYNHKTKDLIFPIKEYCSSDSIPSLADILKSRWRGAKDFHWIMEHICERKEPLDFDLNFPILSSETKSLLEELRVQSGLSCPIILQNQCFALLFIQQVKGKRIWTDDDREMIKGIADQTAIAIYQAQLFAQLSESESRFREISESNMIGIFFWNMDGVITDANEAFLSLIGYTRNEIHSRKVCWRDITPPEFYGRDQQAIEELHEQGTFTPYEKQLLLKDGRRIDVLIGGALLENSDDNGVAFTLDITERKKAEQGLQDSKDEIRKLADELEQRVIERTAQLEAVNRELEAFSYSVSHDLRAPLRSIDGFSQAVLEDYSDKLDERGRNYLQRVRDGSQHMAKLIDDMLQLSRLTRGSLNIEEDVDLSAIAREIAENLKRQEPGREVEISIEEDLHANCDRRLMQAVLQNMFDNAWKFTSKHQVAHIQFGLTVNKGKRAYFIQDDGAGFDMTYVHKLFGAFQRLHTADEFPGTGVGLATVARIIHRHGGEIWAESAVEKGATFYFTLNHATPGRAPVQGSMRETANAKP